MNKTPEISVNKLAEFVSASDKRKWSILKTIKSSNVEDMAKRIRYSTAKSALRKFFLDEEHSPKIFDDKKETLLKKDVTTPLKKNDRDNSVIAIKRLEECSKNILRPYLSFKSLPGLPKEKRNNRMDGVVVHLTPEIVFTDKKTKMVCGALKVAFTKKALTPMEGQIVAGLIHKHLERLFKTPIDAKNCFVLDVFAKRIFTAPESFRYHCIRLKKAFSEINVLWPKVA
jgi:hypothetical protein